MTSEVIVRRARPPHDHGMTFRRFLLIDSLALDVAGIAALVAGATTLGVVVLALAALTFLAWIGVGRRAALVS